MQNELKLLAETESPEYSTKAYLNPKNGQVELWERNNKTTYGYWQLNRSLDFSHIKTYAALLNEVISKVK
jgi:hypothetical protein